MREWTAPMRGLPSPAACDRPPSRRKCWTWRETKRPAHPPPDRPNGHPALGYRRCRRRCRYHPRQRERAFGRPMAICHTKSRRNTGAAPAARLLGYKIVYFGKSGPTPVLLGSRLLSTGRPCAVLSAGEPGIDALTGKVLENSKEGGQPV